MDLIAKLDLVALGDPNHTLDLSHVALVLGVSLGGTPFTISALLLLGYERGDVGEV